MLLAAADADSACLALRRRAVSPALRVALPLVTPPNRYNNRPVSTNQTEPTTTITTTTTPQQPHQPAAPTASTSIRRSSAARPSTPRACASRCSSACAPRRRRRRGRAGTTRRSAPWGAASRRCRASASRRATGSRRRAPRVRGPVVEDLSPSVGWDRGDRQAMQRGRRLACTAPACLAQASTSTPPSPRPLNHSLRSLSHTLCRIHAHPQQASTRSRPSSA